MLFNPQLGGWKEEIRMVIFRLALTNNAYKKEISKMKKSVLVMAIASTILMVSTANAKVGIGGGGLTGPKPSINSFNVSMNQRSHPVYAFTTTPPRTPGNSISASWSVSGTSSCNFEYPNSSMSVSTNSFAVFSLANEYDQVKLKCANNNGTVSRSISLGTVPGLPELKVEEVSSMSKKVVPISGNHYGPYHAHEYTIIFKSRNAISCDYKPIGSGKFITENPRVISTDDTTRTWSLKFRYGLNESPTFDIVCDGYHPVYGNIVSSNALRYSE